MGKEMKEWILQDDGRDTPDALQAVPYSKERFERIYGLKYHVREVLPTDDARERAIEGMREAFLKTSNLLDRLHATTTSEVARIDSMEAKTIIDQALAAFENVK